jgi:ABC-type sugar transport system ATPase subunit
MAELQLRGLVKHYGGVLALDHVDFTISTGEIVCLLGENGAGKSTLANIISGQVHRDAGEYHIDGDAVDIKTPASAHLHGIRTVPQELSLVPAMSVAENILLGQLPTGHMGTFDRREMNRLAANRLKELSLGHLPVNRPVSALRVVEQVFVEIARAMTPGCRFLIADEPTAPMSSAEADILLRVLTSITTSGVGVVFVSHRLGEVLRIGHRVEVLRDGRNALSSPVDVLSRNDLVRAMTGGKELARAMARIDSVGPDRLDVQGLSSGMLESVSLTVAKGEIVGIYGGAGSGREDLGPAIFGTQKRVSGQVSVDGTVIGTTKPLSSVQGGISYVPAERRSKGLLINRSIQDNITLASLRKVSRFGILNGAAESRTANAWRQRLRIKCPNIGVPVNSLSGGNQQKALLARWLELNNPVIVLDEPTRGVDVRTKAEIYQLLGELAADGVAVLVISSDAEELGTCCDRVLVLRGGVVVNQLARPTEDQILEMADAERHAS